MLDNSTEVYIPENTKFSPYQVREPEAPSNEDNNDAFYASVLSGVEDPVSFYEEIEKEKESNNGLSSIINSVRAYYKEQKDMDQAMTIEGIIADETIPVEDKKTILRNYSVGRTLDVDLQDEYLNYLSSIELANKPEVTEEDLEIADFNIATTKLEQDLEKAGGNFITNSKTLSSMPEKVKDTINNIGDLVSTIDTISTAGRREVLNLAQVILGAIPYFVELSNNVMYQAAAELGEKAELDFLKRAYPDVDWETSREKIADFIGSRKWSESLNEFVVNYVPGYEEEDMHKGLIGGLLNLIGKGIEKGGEKLTPEDPGKGKTLLELGLFFIDPIIRITRAKFKKPTELPSKNKLKEEISNIIDNPDLFVPNKPKLTSPFVETVRMHPQLAKDMGNMLLEDFSGKAWKALKITPEEFFATYYGPRIFDFERSRVNLYDATDAINLKFTEYKLKNYKQQAILESTYKDVPERLQFGESVIQDIGGILDDPAIRMINSDLEVISSGTQIYVSTSFRKGADQFYTNPTEAIAYAKYIEDVLQRQYQVRNINKKSEAPFEKQEIVIEFIEKDGTVNANKSRTLDEFIKENKDNLLEQGQYNIRWQRVGDFTNTIRKNSSGFGYFGHQDKPILKYLYGSKSQLDKLFFNYGGVGKDVQLVKDMGGLKAFNVLYTELETLVSLVNKQSQQFRTDLNVILDRMPRYFRDKHADILNTTVYEKITKQDLAVMLNHTPKYLDDLMTAVTLIEDINYFKWQANNVFEINRGIKSGYDKHVVLEDFATGSKHNYLVKNPSDTLALDLNKVLEVLDLEGQKAVAVTGMNYRFSGGKHYLVDADGVPQKQILRLGKEFVGPDLVGPVQGQRPARGKYNYIAVDLKAQLGGIPNTLVPYRPYYVPLMVKDMVFIRRYPKVTKTDGVVKDLSTRSEAEVIKTHSAERETIGGFADSKQASKWEATQVLDRENYVYKIEKADELSWRDANEYIKLQEQALRTSSRRGDHLRVATYHDPLMSIIETSKLVGTRSFLQNVFEQQKIGWVEKWGKNPNIRIEPNAEKLSRGERSILGREFMDEQAVVYDNFPLTKEQIKPVTSGDQAFANQAIREWEALTEITSGFADDIVARGFNQLAETLGNISKDVEAKIDSKWLNLERKFLALEGHPSFLVDGARNLVTTAYTLWALPWKHWIQQPFQGLAYTSVAASFNPLTTAKLLYDATSMIHAVGFRQIKNKDLRAKIYEQTVKGVKLVDENGKAVPYKATKLEELLYLHDALYDRGVFNLSEHILAKGVFNNKTVGLADGWFRRNARNLTNFLSKLGLQTGEFMHRAAAAQAALHLWKQRNPGKKWYQNAKAMDEIAQATRQLTQSMDRMAVNTFQRSGLLKPFAQLQTFQARAGESILIGDATPFTGKQRVAQQVFNTLNLGVDVSIPFGFGYVVSEAIAYMFGEDVADKLNKGVAVDMGMQLAADNINPTYDDEGNQVFTTTRPSKFLSPYGDTPGLFYVDFVKQVLMMMGFMSPEQRTGNIALEYWKDTYANVKMMWNSLGLNKDTSVQIQAGVESLFKLVGMGKQALSTYYYDTSTKMIHNLQGQETGIKGSDTDRLLTFLLNSRPEGVRKQFEILGTYRGQTQKLKNLANDTFDALVLGHGTKKLSIVEIYDAIGGVAYTLKEVHNVKEADMKIFWSQLELKNNQRNRSVKQNILNELVKDMQAHLDDLNKEDIAALQQILTIFDENPQTNPDYGIILEGIQSRSGKKIGITTELVKE